MNFTLTKNQTKFAIVALMVLLAVFALTAVSQPDMLADVYADCVSNCSIISPTDGSG